MKIARSKIILLAIFAVVLLVLIAKFLSILSIPENKNILRIQQVFPTMDTGGYPKTKPITLYADNPVTQKIKASRDNFDQVNIAFENFPGDIRDNIIFRLGTENCEPIYEKNLNAFSFWLAADTIYTRLKFPVQKDSAGKTYCLQFTSKLVGARTNNSPRILTFRSENDSIVNAAQGGKTFTRTSLLFKSAYSEGSVWKNIETLINRMSQYKPAFFKGISLAIILFLSFVSAIFLVFLFVMVL